MREVIGGEDPVKPPMPEGPELRVTMDGIHTLPTWKTVGILLVWMIGYAVYHFLEQ